MTFISNTDDTIDITDVIESIEELRDELPEDVHDVMPGTSEELREVREELAGLEELLVACKGLGGDEKYEGDWYPSQLIHETYFNQAMDEMIADCYTLPELPFWMTITYDYDALLQDYRSVDFDGETYYCRVV